MRPDPYAWTIHPEALAGIAVLVAAYALAARRHETPRWRIACFAFGALLLLATAVTPLDALSFHLLSAHLLQNVVLAEWAPALVVLGVPPGLGAAISHVGAVRALTRPWIALPLWLATYFLWHLPAAYDAALEQPVLLHAEHASYFAAGCLLWWSAFQDEPWHLGAGTRAAYMFAAFVLGSPLGLLLAFLPDAVYDFYVEGGAFDVSPLADQQIAGMTMAFEQAAVFFAAFTVFFLRFLSEQDLEEVRPGAG